MSNLITPDRKALLKKIFYSRLSITFLSWVLIALTLVFVSFFSIFIFSKNELSWQKEALAKLESTLESYKSQTERSNTDTLLQVANTVIKKRQPPISSALQASLSLLVNSDIAPKKIIISHKDNDSQNKSNALNVYIAALAKNKEPITQLLKVIKASEHFTGLNVSGLVSSLKEDKSGNVHFEFNLKYQER